MSTFIVDYHTESFGTAIVDLIPAHEDPDLIPRVTSLSYRCGTTAHTVTLMRVVATTKTTHSATTAQKVLQLETIRPGKDTSGSDEDLAASDYLAWVDSNGQTQFDIIASVTTASNQVTMTANLPTTVDADAKVWAFYEVGRASNVAFGPAASATRDYVGLTVTGGIPYQLDRYNAKSGAGEPMLVHSNNITADGFLEQVSGIYVSADDIAIS